MLSAKAAGTPTVKRVTSKSAITRSARDHRRQSFTMSRIALPLALFAPVNGTNIGNKNGKIVRPPL